jgi:hypothetical protein
MKYKINWFGRPGNWHDLSDYTIEETRNAIDRYFDRRSGFYTNCAYEIEGVVEHYMSTEA